jgi:hypothetical protein
MQFLSRMTTTRAGDTATLEHLGGFSIAEIGTPFHPVLSQTARHRARPILRTLAVFAAGAMIGAPLGSALAFRSRDLSTARAGHSSAIAHGRGPSATPVAGAGPSCTEDAALIPEQFIELDTMPVAGATTNANAAKHPAIVASQNPRAAHALQTAILSSAPPAPPKSSEIAKSPEIPKSSEATDDAPPARSSLDPEAARAAIRSVDIGPTACGEDAHGPVNVAVTFAASGRATRAVVEGGLPAGTESGSCIATRLGGLQIKSFDGPLTTVHTRIRLP